MKMWGTVVGRYCCCGGGEGWGKWDSAEWLVG